MDMLEQALDSGEEKADSDSGAQIELEGGAEGMGGMGQGTLTIDANGQYRLTTDTGQVTYRVVQVAQGDDGQSQLLNNTIPTPTQVIPSFNVPEPTGVEGLTDTKLTYIPTVSGGGDAVAADASGSLSSVSASGGQYFVMMSPQDVLQAAGQRVIAPRANIVTGQRVDAPRTTRDDRRRQSHNEVERRRRDKINNWIVQLSKLIPNCDADITKAGQVSKGGILSKACDHINELRGANAQMAETLKEAERFSVDNELLRQQVEELKQENALLRNQLTQHGVLMPDINGS